MEKKKNKKNIKSFFRVRISDAGQTLEVRITGLAESVAGLASLRCLILVVFKRAGRGAAPVQEIGVRYAARAVRRGSLAGQAGLGAVLALL